MDLDRRIGPRHDAHPLHGLPELAPVDRQLIRVPLRNELAVLRELPLDQPGDQTVPAHLADGMGLPGPDGHLGHPGGPEMPPELDERPARHDHLPVGRSLLERDLPESKAVAVRRHQAHRPVGEGPQDPRQHGPDLVRARRPDHLP